MFPPPAATTVSRPRLPRLAVAAAFLTFIALSAYGIEGPFTWGHSAFHAAEYAKRARNTLRHGTFLPGNDPGWSEPTDASLYLHHPVLTHHLMTVTFAIMGDTRPAVRVAALLGSGGTLVLLTLLLWRRWGPWYGAFGAWVFTLSPLVAWFATLPDVGFPSIACVLAFFLFYLAWLDHGRWRDGGLALGFIALAGGFEWSPFLVAVAVLPYQAWRAIRERGRQLAFLGLAAVAVVAPYAIHVAIVKLTHHLPEMTQAYEHRTGTPRDLVLVGTIVKYLFAMFTRWLVWLSVPWCLVQLVRLARGRTTARDLVAWSFLFALWAYTAIFPQAIVIHVYRVMYAQIFFVIVACDVVSWVDRRARRAAVALALLLLVVMTPSTRVALFESRINGLVPLQTRRLDPWLDKFGFIQAVAHHTRPGDVVYVHPNVQYRRDVDYYLDRDIEHVYTISQATRAKRPGVLICVPSSFTKPEQARWEALAADHFVLRVGKYGMLDLRPGEPGGIRTERLVWPSPSRRWLSRWLQGPYHLPAREAIAPSTAL